MRIMKKILNILVIGTLLMFVSTSCKKQDDGVVRLTQLAKELNSAPDKELNNGTILTGCEFEEGDSLFTYIIKVSDNRFDDLEVDSIKRNFAKTVKSDGMKKIINLLNQANVGLKYRLELPEKEVLIEFPSSEITGFSKSATK